LQEAEAVCNRVLILNQGRIAAQGTSDEIASSLKGGLRWEILVKGANSSLLREKLKSLGKLGRFEIGTATGPTVFPVSLFISSSSTPFSGETIFDWALSEKLKLLSMSEHRANLEDLFVQLTSIGDQEGTQE
jgi:ABC-2 type transport system ATP-binding protein